MCSEENMLLTERFWLLGVLGTILAMFGVVANALLTILFLSQLAYRHSPFFFLGFVAFYDTLLDFTYLLLLVSRHCFSNADLTYKRAQSGVTDSLPACERGTNRCLWQLQCFDS